MPQKRKGSPYWWISYTDASGKRVRQSTGTTSRKEAVALESRARLDAHKQQQWGDQPRRTFDELILKYLQETVDAKKSSDRDRYSALRLKPHFTGRYLDEIEPDDINQYRHARIAEGVKNHKGEIIRPVSDSTILKELRLFSSALNRARSVWGWQVENVVAGRGPKHPPGKLRWLTRPEYAALVKAAQENKRAPYLADFVRLVTATGMRHDEALGLEWSRVDLDARLAYFRPDDSKGGNFASIPLNNTAAEILQRRKADGGRYVFERDGERMGSVKKAFGSIVEAAGLGSDVTVHTLRHTCAAWLVQAGVPLRTVRDIMRHKDIRTTMIYAHLAPENVREGVAALDKSL